MKITSKLKKIISTLVCVMMVFGTFPVHMLNASVFAGNEVVYCAQTAAVPNVAEGVENENAQSDESSGQQVFELAEDDILLEGGDGAAEGTQATIFASLSAADVVKRVGALFTEDQKKTGILASVSMAQFILESGYGKSELAQNANNVFGMKCTLSGNTWSGSTWDGNSKYTKQTKEQHMDGSYRIITADFRKYPCIEASIADHSAYLLGAKNGSKLRYDGLRGCSNYKKAVCIIKDGGYATSLSYVDNLCCIIERWNLVQFDVK